MAGWGRFATRLRTVGVREAFRKQANYQDFKVGTLVGTDAAGNKYFEDTSESAQHLRHRWVEYNQTPSAVSAAMMLDSTTVPSHWHAWLHHSTDLPGDEVELRFGQPWSLKTARTNATGTSQAYVPPGYLMSRNFEVELDKRSREDWTTVEPAGSSGHGHGQQEEAWRPVEPEALPEDEAVAGSSKM